MLRTLIIASLFLAPATIATAAALPGMDVPQPTGDFAIIRLCYMLYGTPLFQQCISTFFTIYKTCFTLPFPGNIVCFQLA